MPCPCRGRSAQLVLPEPKPGIVRRMFARFSEPGANPASGLSLRRPLLSPFPEGGFVLKRLTTEPARLLSALSLNRKNINPGACLFKPSPELLRCRAGAIPDEQRDGSLPVKLVAVAEASGQRKTRWLWQAQRVSPSRVKFVSRMPVRTCGASAKRGRFARIFCEIIPARVLPCAIPAATRGAQRASMCGTSAPACPPRPSRRGLSSRTG